MPQNIRPANLNKAKVPAPAYRPAQSPRSTKNKIIEEVTTTHESRGILKRFF